MNFDTGNHNNLFLSIGSFFGSLLSCFVAEATKYNLMWFVGFIAGIVSIWAGILTIKERRMSIRQMKKHNNF